MINLKPAADNTSGLIKKGCDVWDDIKGSVVEKGDGQVRSIILQGTNWYGFVNGEGVVRYAAHVDVSNVVTIPPPPSGYYETFMNALVQDVLGKVLEAAGNG